MVKGRKLSRAGKTDTCLLCKNTGHNKRSFKGQQMGSQGGSQTTNNGGLKKVRLLVEETSMMQDLKAMLLYMIWYLIINGFGMMCGSQVS